MQLYATLTGTSDNLEAMSLGGVRLLVGPDQLARCSSTPPLAWAVDNGAWGCFQRGEVWDAGLFREVLARWGGAADWIVAPDVVAGGLASLALSESWLPEVLDSGRPALIAVQDGMEISDVVPLLGPRVGIFVGGSTAWKWETMPMWSLAAAGARCHIHVGRVNSARRIRLCADHGVVSTDGTSPAIYGTTTPRLAAAARAPSHPMLPFGGVDS